jgi:circadian clock protein KaiA
MVFPSDSASRPKLSVCTFTKPGPLTGQLDQSLAGEHYISLHFHAPDPFFRAVEEDFSSIDCLIFEQSADLLAIINRLHHSAILLPAVILTERQPLQNQPSTADDPQPIRVCYHTAETYLDPRELPSVTHTIESAISRFLRLSPHCRLPIAQTLNEDSKQDISVLTLQETLCAQQRRLSEKIKERLGYLGIFYKRDPQLFFRNLSRSEQIQFLGELKEDYREIILVYFQEKTDVNQKIDAFVNKVFFSDLSVSQVLETHMELMDLLAKKLKLEGRSEDVLLDYRLTLIDTVAHLCEMYRRSIPRKP